MVESALSAQSVDINASEIIDSAPCELVIDRYSESTVRSAMRPRMRQASVISESDRTEMPPHERIN